jgi:hypothetical protein
MKEFKDIPQDRPEKFKVPKDYFEDLKAELALKAAMHGKDNPSFSLPENYLQELNKELKSIPDQSRVIPLWKSTAFRIALSGVAATILLFLFIGNPFEKDCESFACLMEQTELSEEELLWIDEALIEEAYLETVSENEMNNSDEAYIDYLLEEDISMDALLEEDPYLE